MQRQPRRRRRSVPRSDPAHAAGKRKLGPPPETGQRLLEGHTKQARDQPWVPTSGFVGRKRRSARRG